MIKSNNITIYIIVYNDENRIENLLKNCQWSDDIIIYDKSSTDRTREIASKYPCRIINVPYYNTGAGPAKNIINEAKNEWIIHLSCSDIIHPNLVNKIFNLINQKNFGYDVIAFPYIVGVLGIIDHRSPWSVSPLKKYLFKKSTVIFSEQVHKEITFKPGAKIYKMEKSDTEAVFHLTHENLDTLFERHIRYTKAEAQKYKIKTEGYWKSLGRFFASIFWMIFVRRILFMGWKGIALFFAFLSYFIMEFLYTWEQFDGKGNETYEKMRNYMLSEWTTFYKEKHTQEQIKALISPLKPHNVKLKETHEEILSIAIPTYNRASYLKELLDSIKNQFDNNVLTNRVKIYVFDNDSKDQTENVVKNSGLNIIYKRNEYNIGAASNILQAYMTVTGKYVWILGDDEAILDNAITNILNTIEKYSPSLIIAKSQWFLLPPQSQKIFNNAFDFFVYYATHYPFLLFAQTFISFNIVNKRIINNDLFFDKIFNTPYPQAYTIASGLKGLTDSIIVTDTNIVYIRHNRAKGEVPERFNMDVANNFFYIRIKLYEYLEWLKLEYNLPKFNVYRTYWLCIIKRLITHDFWIDPIFTLKFIYYTLQRETIRLLKNKPQNNNEIYKNNNQ